MNWFSRWLLRRHYGRYVDPAIVKILESDTPCKIEPVFCQFSFVLVELPTSASADHTDTFRALRSCNARVGSILGNLLLAYFVDENLDGAEAAAATLAGMSLRAIWGKADGWIGDAGTNDFAHFGPMFDVLPAVALLRNLSPGSCAQVNTQAK